MLHQIVAQPFGFVHGRLKLRFRLVGIETVLGHQHYVIDLRHFFRRRQHTAVADAAACSNTINPEFS